MPAEPVTHTAMTAANALSPTERLEYERLVDDLRQVAATKAPLGAGWVDAWARALG